MAHFVRAGRVGGAEPMLYNLLQGFVALGIDTTVLCGSKARLAAAVFERESRLHVLESGGAGNRFIAEQAACLQTDQAADATLFPNYYVPPIIPRRLGRIGVVMHDYQYRHFPQYFSPKKRAWLRLSQELAVRRADRVIVISEFVRDDTIRLFGGRIARKLVCIPNALSWERFASGLDRARPCSRPYILSVAAQYPHKNLETLIRSFQLVAQAEPDIQLVLCGQSYDGLSGVVARSKDEQLNVTELAATLGLADRVMFTGFVDDPTLAQWYQHAAMFAYPSLFEGFGMPPVEALGFGLPTLTANSTALPEVTRGLARLVDDPLDIKEWASKLIEVLRAPEEHRPTADQVADLKAYYCPTKIAAAYAAALGA